MEVEQMKIAFKKMLVVFTIFIVSLCSFSSYSFAESIQSINVNQKSIVYPTPIENNQEIFIHVDAYGNPTIEVPDKYNTEKNNIEVYNNSVSTIGFTSDAMPDAGNKRIRVSSIVSKITGNSPSQVSIAFQLYRASTRSGSMRLEASSFKSLLFPSMGSSTSDYINLSRTGYYKVRFTYSMAYTTGERPTSATTETGVTLLNRMAREFPGGYTDPISGSSIGEPNADWTKTSSPVSWTKTDRNNFRNWYISTYNQPNYNWTNVEIHHIQPREYGGTNSYSNLIPLPKGVHTLYTSWFAGY